MKIKNVLDPEAANIHHLAAAMQDCWHYATLINPALSSDESTFAGESEYAGLLGKLEAYGNLCRYVRQWSYESLPVFCEITLPPVEHINTVEQLTEAARVAMVAIQTVCKANEIDGRTGLFIRWYILNPAGNPVFSSVVPCLPHVFKHRTEARAYVREFYLEQGYSVVPSNEFDIDEHLTSAERAAARQGGAL